MKSIIGSAGIISILFIIFSLAIPCLASDINIVGTVTPTSGKEDTNFIYSATITFSKGNFDINSPLNVELIISDNRVNKSYLPIGKILWQWPLPGGVDTGTKRSLYLFLQPWPGGAHEYR